MRHYWLMYQYIYIYIYCHISCVDCGLVVPGGLADKNVNFLWDEKEAKN